MNVLYSFRRCPYAMRARMALAAAGLEIGIREILLRDKPSEMLAASSKGTVPVLVLTDGRVIDESLDVMRWALAQNDPEAWLSADPDETSRLITQNDGPFKHALDRYKYAGRHGTDAATHRAGAMHILADLAARIDSNGGHLAGPATALADIAIFPFVRQFAATDETWWQAHAPCGLQDWLTGHATSPRFDTIMRKLPPWRPGADEPPLIAP